MNPATIRSKSLCKISNNTISYIYKPTNQLNAYKFFYYRYSPEGSVVECGSTLMYIYFHDENAMDGFPTDEEEKEYDSCFDCILYPKSIAEREFRRHALYVITSHLANIIKMLSGSYIPTSTKDMVVWWDEGCGELCNRCITSDFIYTWKVGGHGYTSDDIKTAFESIENQKPKPNWKEIMDNKEFSKVVREGIWEQAQKTYNGCYCVCKENEPSTTELSSSEEEGPPTKKPFFRSVVDCILFPQTEGEKEARLFAAEALEYHLIATYTEIKNTKRSTTGKRIAEDLECAIADICDKCLWDLFWLNWGDQSPKEIRTELDDTILTLHGSKGKWKEMMRNEVFANEVRANIRKWKTTAHLETGWCDC